MPVIDCLWRDSNQRQVLEKWQATGGVESSVVKAQIGPHVQIRPPIFFSTSTSGVYMYRYALLGMMPTRCLHLLTRSFRPPHIVRFSASIRMSSATQTHESTLFRRPGGQTSRRPNFRFRGPWPAHCGWAQFEFGEKFGQDNRYIIARKLGWGMHSSTWARSR